MKIPAHARNLFILGSINPVVPAMYNEAAGKAGMLIYFWVRWKMHLPDYITKAKSDWVKLDNVSMHRHKYKMDPKTKSKALRKLVEAGLIEMELIEKSGKAPQVKLLVK